MIAISVVNKKDRFRIKLIVKFDESSQNHYPSSGCNICYLAHLVCQKIYGDFLKSYPMEIIKFAVVYWNFSQFSLDGF